jgi:hypothetical protein
MVAVIEVGAIEEEAREEARAAVARAVAKAEAMEVVTAKATAAQVRPCQIRQFQRVAHRFTCRVLRVD